MRAVRVRQLQIFDDAARIVSQGGAELPGEACGEEPQEGFYKANWGGEQVRKAKVGAEGKEGQREVLLVTPNVKGLSACAEVDGDRALGHEGGPRWPVFVCGATEGADGVQRPEERFHCGVAIII